MEQWPKPSMDKKINDPEAAAKLAQEVREKLLAGTLVPKKQEGGAKVETPEEKAARRAAFAEKMAGKSFEEMGKIVTHEKYVPGESKEDGKAA